MAKLTVKEINKNTDVLVSNIKKMGSEIQAHLVTLAYHVIDTGDVQPVSRFFTKIEMLDKEGKSTSIVRADAIGNWLTTFAAVKISKDGVELAKKARNDIRVDSEIDPENGNILVEGETFKAHMKQAKAEKWNVLTRAKAFVSFDFYARLDALIKQAGEQLERKAELLASGEKDEKGELLADKVKVTAEEIAALKAFRDGKEIKSETQQMQTPANDENGVPYAPVAA